MLIRILIIILLLAILLLVYLIYAENIFKKMNTPELIEEERGYPTKSQITGTTTTSDVVVTIQQEFARLMSSLYICTGIRELNPHGRAESITSEPKRTPSPIWCSPKSKDDVITIKGVKTNFIAAIPRISFL